MQNHLLWRTLGFFRKVISSFVALTFLTSLIVVPINAQSLSANSVVALPSAFQPPVLLGLKVHPENPLLFDFIVDQGQTKLSTEELKEETEKLVKYFLAALTIPDKEVWVNLSPYEKDRIIPDVLGQTTMGKTMLEQDYVLKQMASSLTNPETELGKKYWDQVNNAERLDARRSLTPNPQPLVPNQLNKVWIMPAKAEVLESNGIVLVGEKRLQVMLAEDYETVTKSTVIARSPQGDAAISKAEIASLPLVARNDTTTDQSPITSPHPLITNTSSQIFRQTILPAIDKAVNESQDFADVRQIYNSVILAAWYKKALKESLLGKIYADQGKVAGVETDDKAMKKRIYEQYLAAFKKGAYNLIKEEVDADGDLIPHKYFSGGAVFEVAHIVFSTPITLDKVGEIIDGVSSSAAITVQFATTKNEVGNNISASSGVDDLRQNMDRIKSLRIEGAFVALAHQQSPYRSNEYLNAQLLRWGVETVRRDAFIAFARKLSVISGLMIVPREFREAYEQYSDIYNSLTLAVLPHSLDLKQTQFDAVDAALASLSDRQFQEYLASHSLTGTREFFKLMAKNDEQLFPSRQLDQFLEFALEKAQLSQMPLLGTIDEGLSDELNAGNIEGRAFYAADQIFDQLLQQKSLGLNKKDNVANQVLRSIVYEMALQIWGENLTVDEAMQDTLDAQTVRALKPNHNVTDDQMSLILKRLDLKNGIPGEMISPLLNEKLQPFSASSTVNVEEAVKIFNNLPANPDVLRETLKSLGDVPFLAVLEAAIRVPEHDEYFTVEDYYYYGLVKRTSLTYVNRIALMDAVIRLKTKQKPQNDQSTPQFVRDFLKEVKAYLHPFNSAKKGNQTMLLANDFERLNTIVADLRRILSGDYFNTDYHLINQAYTDFKKIKVYFRSLNESFESLQRLKDNMAARYADPDQVAQEIISILKTSKWPHGKTALNLMVDTAVLIVNNYSVRNPNALKRSLSVRLNSGNADSSYLRVLKLRLNSAAASSAVNDKAIVASSPTVEDQATKGGIDFDSTTMDLQIKRDGKGVPLPLLQQNLELINIPGLFPVIINIMPINAQNLPIFLGQLPKEPAKEIERIVGI
ncbi:MAG: hypothetical protein H6753_06280 [Candidatus Omnitrophica bacterium]|nr:hypothetical protein [Candidatus Omnitrophota bacterium]